MSLSEDQLHTLNLMVNQVNNIRDTLPNQLESINKSLNDLQGRISHFEVQMQELYNQLQHQQNVNVTHTPKIKIRLPTPFSGQASMCNTFFSQLSLYFAGDSSYDTDDKKILLATSCLTGPAYAYMEPFLCKLNATEKPEVLTNYKVFMDTITAAFGDSDPTLSAELALRRLRQTSSATTYATEFRRLSSLVYWNNAALVSQYKVNLRDVIQDELARRPVIQDLESLILESIDIDNRLFQRQRSKRLNQSPIISKDTRTTTPVAMDIDKPSSSVAPSSRHVPQEERLRRSQDKACYYCGVVGHFSNQCPAKKSQFSRPTVSTILLGNQDSSRVIPPLPSINMIASIGDSLPDYKKPVFVSDDLDCVEVNYGHSDTGMLFIPVNIGPTQELGLSIVPALVDTGAAHCVISRNLARALGLSIVPPGPNHANLTIADGSVPQSSGTCTTKVRLVHSIFHVEEVTFYVMDTATFDVILGLDWFKKHHVTIDFNAKATLLRCNPIICCDDGRPRVFTDAPWDKKPPVEVPSLEVEMYSPTSPGIDEFFPEDIKLSYPEHPLPPGYVMTKEDILATRAPFINKDTVYFYSS